MSLFLEILVHSGGNPGIGLAYTDHTGSICCTQLVIACSNLTLISSDNLIATQLALRLYVGQERHRRHYIHVYIHTCIQLQSELEWKHRRHYIHVYNCKVNLNEHTSQISITNARTAKWSNCVRANTRALENDNKSSEIGLIHQRESNRDIVKEMV